MGFAAPKAFLPLGGVALTIHSISTLACACDVTAVVLVVAEDCIASANAALAHHGPWPVPVRVTGGGHERQDSVAAGVAAAEPTADLLLVHDAARPFVSPACVTACIAAARTGGAAIVAVPARDTVKLVGADGAITQTLDRQTVWLAQTPQVFRADLLRRALAAAHDDGYVATDDAALVERLGIPVRVVLGDAINVKITTPEDLQWAEWYLGQRRSAADARVFSADAPRRRSR
jgi:2-C-methyl-D-erythritol 4-phosphate cytidylyltransferase